MKISLPEQVTQASRANALLQDPTLMGAFDNVAKAIHEQWESCPLRDHEGQHELKLMLKLLNDVKAVLETAVMDGKVASAELKRTNVISPKEFFNR